ncbi:HAMP domain-containing protein [Clostridium cavendishii DSM 21758]|uniref:histidine kinase n=1 Tax=Clostridium cavendishii DSM 21758 TaxID=1121302 RepID=A0A1M6UNM1_9CLOT|nr:HAMP domain-containing sensor histidine kinase [Clostridium cavendishii]SHK70804.1 HAMP domain-containing protein [Clostridium cavendishii DSM 21758]
MKNKLFKSLNSQFLVVIIISVIIILLTISFANNGIMNEINAINNRNRMNDINNRKGLSDNFNAFYVDSIRFVTRLDNGCEEYLQKLAKLYDVNAAITDNEGNILMKSKDVSVTKIDLEELKNIYKGKIEVKDKFYQRYDIRLDEKEYKFIVWKESKYEELNIREIYIRTWSPFLIIIIIMLSLIYIFTNKKVKYIEKISKGLEEFSEGNLDYSIKEKGNDELYLLAKNSNIMAQNLKAMIEEEQRVQRLKTDLITNVSHDLRTPLTSLIGYLQLLNDDNIKEEDKAKYANVSLDKAKNLSGLIEDLFNYSKLESGGITLEKFDVNIIEILEQTIGEASLDIANKEISIEKNFEDKSIMANVDPMQIGRVFQNLLNNAVKYGMHNSKIIVSAFERKNEINISFKNKTDNLINENIDLLFERFYRGDISRNSKIKGSGLGLAIAKSIINLHNGYIDVDVKDEMFTITVILNKV